MEAVPHERREPERQEPKLDGVRASDPRWTTRDIAQRLGVSPAFVVGEIRDGRLGALVIARPDHNAVYRISDEQFEAYCRRFCWTPAPQ